MVIAPSGSES